MGQTTTVRSCDGHFLRADPNLSVDVRPDDAGPWEQWALELQADGRVAVRSWHGTYLRAEPQGRVNLTAAGVGPWECWQVVAGDSGVGLRSCHGRFLCAEGGGGSSVVANRTVLGPWEQWQVAGTGQPPRSGRVTLTGRAMTDDAGPWNALGTTLMWAVREARTPHLTANLSWLQTQQVECVRALGEATDWAEDVRIDPRVPGWTDKLRAVRDEALSFGQRIQWTVFGGNQLTPTDQMRAVENLLLVCREIPAHVQGIEISNEGQGFQDADGPRRLREFGEIFARHGFPTALTSWESGPADLYAGSAATVATEHFERTISAADGYWRPVRQPWGYWDHAACPAAFINGEPIGIGSSVAQDTDPLRLACAAAVTWLTGGALHIVHTGAGVYGVPMTHPTAGYRPANLYEQPTLGPTFSAIAALRGLLPPDLPTWQRQNHHWPGHPFTFDPYQPGDESLAHDFGCVRAYAATLGSDFVCLPVGVMVTPATPSFVMSPKQAMAWTTYDPLTGAVLETGSGPIFIEREVLIVGQLD